MSATASRPVPDDLTIAYVAMGAKAAILAQPERCLPTAVADHHGGELGFIQSVIGEAWRLEERAKAFEDEGFPGVFVYEVAEPFGEQYATALIAHHGADPTPIVDQLYEAFDHEPGLRPA